MLPFVILLFIPLLIQHAVIDKNYVDFSQKNKRALLFFFGVLFVLLAFRHTSIGNDTENYIRYFENISVVDWGNLKKQSHELGFSYYIKTVSLFTDNPQMFLAITAFITIAMIYPTYKRLCEDTSLTILLFCTISTFVMMFSGIRQMIAVGIGFIAYECSRNQKLIPFILCVVLAISFHTSAFMLIFMYPLYHAKITKKWLLAVIPMLGLLFIYNEEIFAVLSLILTRYTEYEAVITQTGAYTMIILFAAFAVFSFLIPDEKSLDKETIALRNILLFSLTIQLFAPLNMLAMRMNYYYIIFIPLLLPKIIKYKNERYRQVAIVGRHIMVVFFLLYFFYNALTSTSNLNVFPYHFFWEKV